MIPTYNIHKSYDWNYENGPLFEGLISDRPESTKKTNLFDFELNSPLGVPAGPLLNSNWIKLYAELGWDIPVYKTVRTVYRECHPNPNCIYIPQEEQFEEKDAGSDVVGVFEDQEDSSKVTITNSFGMPSKEPEEWMRDVEKANSYLSDGQVMVVSIVGTPGEGKSLPADYARCAKMAKEAGARIIEANYSCPNVCSGEGSIFTDPDLSSEISQAIRLEIGNTPLMIKVGNFINLEILEDMVAMNVPFINGISGINTIAMKVYDKYGNQALTGKNRLTSGLCGYGIHDISQRFTENLARIRNEDNYDFIICGVGGITSVEGVEARLNGGADIVMSATGAMWNPMLAMEYHQGKLNITVTRN